MTGLSWLIYFAGVSGEFSSALMVFGILFGFATLIAGCIMIAAVSCVGDPHSVGFQDALLWANRARRYFHAFIGACIFFVLASCVFPSRNTVLAIAASEVGQRIAATDVVQDASKEAYGALKNWIAEQMTPPPKKETK